MQYILTQQEYDDLRRAQGALETVKKEALQKLCTEAANHIPVKRWGRTSDSRPWGCILDGESPNYDGYCDECPAQAVCPHEDKDWSQ